MSDRTENVNTDTPPESPVTDTPKQSISSTTSSSAAAAASVELSPEVRVPELVSSDPRLPAAADLQSAQAATAATADSGVAATSQLLADVNFDEVSAAAGAGRCSPISGASYRTKQTARWKADAQILEQIVLFGYTRRAGERALFHTNNRSADEAVGWLLDHPEALNEEKSLEAEGDTSSDSEAELASEYQEMLATATQAYKMALVVNNSLKMGTGKVAAQCAHATLGLYRRVLDTGDVGASALASWDSLGETKVVLKADTDEQLKILQMAAKECAVPTYLVRDAGRTQIAAGSTTVLSMFGPAHKIDMIVEKLKLL